MKLIIGNKNYSSWSLRPWMFLKHHNVAFEEHRIALFSDGFKSQIMHFSQAGKVPILVDGDLTVWDSLAICEYVSEAYLDGKGYPEDTKTRALARAAVSEMHSGFMSIREQMPMNCKAVNRKVEMNQSLVTEIARVDELWSGLRQQFAHKGPWLFGQFSIADCMYAPMALRFRTYGVSVSSEATMYMQQLLDCHEVKMWVEQGIAEPEIIDLNEAGSETE